MCKVVYLTSRKFDIPARRFRERLALELQKHGVQVVSQSTCKLSCPFRTHATYGMAIGIDFFRDKGEGRGLTLNENCSHISRNFAYGVANALDIIIPPIHWRDFRHVPSNDRTWYTFFNKVSAETKSIFYLCTYTNISERNDFYVVFDKVIHAFADEIIRCLRSDYDVRNYRQRVKAAKLRTTKINGN